MLQKRDPKILFLTTSDGIGGMSRVVCSLARQFSARGWCVETIFPQMDNTEKLLAWCRAQGVDAEVNPAVLDIVSSHGPRDLLALRQFVASRKPDVVSIHYGENYMSFKDILAIRLAGNFRCVATVYHPTPWSEMGEKKRRMTQLAGLLSQEVTTICTATRDILREAELPERKIHVIRCGVSPPAHLPPKAAARAHFGLPADAFVVGSLARLVAHKGIAELVDACARVSDPRQILRLMVAGDGPERANLERHAEECLPGRTQFLGPVADVNDFYAACDVFCLPSHMEGFGLVFVEAAFHGVPSIGTNIGGVPDAIADGETGLLVPVKDIEALTKAIQTLHGDSALRETLGEQARAHAYADYSEIKMTDAYEAVFRS